MRETGPSLPDAGGREGFITVRGARENNLRDVDVDVPRDSLVVFTGVSGSGKSSLAFGTIYAEAQRRYLESVAPYARRLIQAGGAPDVDSIGGLPPAVALQQRRGAPSTRSTVGTVTTLANSLRMLLSRAGTYPAGAQRLWSDSFSPNTAAGACPRCHGVGVVHDVTEATLVPDPSLSIREGAIAAWPGAWHGKSLRDVLVQLGHDVDAPWRDLPAADREWILFTEEQPVVEVTPQRDRVAKPYRGRFWSARSHVMHTLADSRSPVMRARANRFTITGPCPACGSSGLRPEALAVTFAGRSIAALNDEPLAALAEVLRPTALLTGAAPAIADVASGERTDVAVTIAADLVRRLDVLLDLGLGYLSLGRSTPTLSAGEMQRLRIATQLRSGLFGVVYVLDEPSAGLHPADAEPLMEVLAALRASGNSVLVVEHDMDVARSADWLVDVGPLAGEGGGEVLYSGPPQGLSGVTESVTAGFLDPGAIPGLGSAPRRARREAQGWLRLRGVDANNLAGLDADVPLGVLTAVTGVSGSGKSTLLRVLGDVVAEHVGTGAGGASGSDGTGGARGSDGLDGDPEDEPVPAASVRSVEGLEGLDRLVRVDQRPIGRTPRSNLATYTGLFDAVRAAFAATDAARERGFGASRFSFNVEGGRCPTCQGEGSVSVELLFLPGSHAPCPACHGSRYAPETLEVTYRGKDVGEVLGLSVDAALEHLADVPAAVRRLSVLRQVGLGYLRLGQPAPELSGGEAQRIKLATELQRARRGRTLYLLDEPTTGLHPADVVRLVEQLHALVDGGATVVVVEHDMDIVAGADHVVDLGPAGGDAGGRVVAAGAPEDVAASPASATAPYLARRLPAGAVPA